MLYLQTIFIKLFVASVLTLDIFYFKIKSNNRLELLVCKMNRHLFKLSGFLQTNLHIVHFLSWLTHLMHEGLNREDCLKGLYA